MASAAAPAKTTTLIGVPSMTSTLRESSKTAPDGRDPSPDAATTGIADG